MEYVTHTGTHVTEHLGGILVNGKVNLAVSVPWLDSLLVGFSPSARVVGLNSAPVSKQPPLPTLIHLSFDLMVGIAFGIFALVSWQVWVWWFHRRLPESPWFLVASACSGVASIVAMEAGWVVTEVGRQPWVVYDVLLTANAVTLASGIDVTLAVVLVLYGVIMVFSIGVPLLMARRWRRESPEEEAREQAPYGPPAHPVEVS